MITEGYLARHSMGRRGMTGPALLDVAQDYVLHFLHEQGLFDLGLVLKGGTSLRKFRAGNAGRFSTDLDFAAPDPAVAELLLDTLDGAEHFGVRCAIGGRDGLRGRLEVDTELGRPDVPATIEVTPRPLWLPCERRTPHVLPVHKGYEFEPVALPVPALEEALAEKLAAWRRRRKMRDLYDLYWFGQGALNEMLVRRMLVLKVWHDVVDDGLGTAPFDPAEIVAAFDADKLPPEEIGLLTQPVEPSKWAVFVCDRYRFITVFDDTEQQVARCNPGQRYLVDQLTVALT
ncbi:MAG: nucleotidyl transferase AbiEii/AbiGii toxin family protein [Actinobacteria bacterium]|nr:nucleotidyl transferase AbiEii/AbiGii toxin family protein [Actinomycetota bacterium]